MILIAYILLSTLVLGLVTFVLVYMIGSNWRQNLVGRYIMYFMATIAGTFGYILASPLIRELPGRRLIDLSILVVLNIVAWRLTLLLLNIQKGKFDDAKAKDNTEETLR